MSLEMGAIIVVGVVSFFHVISVDIALRKKLNKLDYEMGCLDGLYGKLRNDLDTLMDGLGKVKSSSHTMLD